MGWLIDEEDRNHIGAPGELPLGVRLAAVFLDIIAIILSIPALGAALNCLLSLGGAAHKPLQASFGIGWSLVSLAGLLAILGMILGATWLARLIRARHAMDERFARWPMHPKSAIVHPMLMATQIHSALCVLAWVVVKLVGYSETSWAWLIFWTVVLVSSELAMRLMGRKGLPW